MDFSSPVLIDFGLNVTGYVLVALLVAVIVRPAARARKADSTEIQASAAQPERKPIPTAQPQTRASSNAEFIPLGNVTQKNRLSAAAAEDSRTASRAEHRRAIYAEARKLLAKGGSRGDLLQRLPLTENEIDALVTTGAARA